MFSTLRLKRASSYFLLLAVLVVPLGLALGFELVRLDQQRRAATDLAETRSEAFEVADRFRRELFELELVARGLAATLSVRPDLSQDEFRFIARALVDSHPLILNIAVAPDQRVEYVYPVEPNRAALGLDYRLIPSQLAGVNNARRHRATIFTGPVRLVQGGSGFVVRSPVFTTEPETGRQSFWGTVSIVVPADRLLEVSGFDEASGRMALRRLTRAGQPGTLLFGPDEVFQGDAVIQNITLEEGVWQLGLRQGMGGPLAWRDSAVILGLTLLSTLLLLGLLLAISRYARNSERMRDLLVHAIASMKDGFALFDAADQLVLCNDTYANFHGAEDRRDLIGLSYPTLVRQGIRSGRYQAEDEAGDLALEQQLLAAFSRGGAVPTQRLSDGRWLQLAYSKTEEGYTACVRVDVTEREAARQAAEAANQSKTEFLDNVSHELRTPLTIILGYTPFLAHPERLPQFRDLRARLGAGGEDCGIDEAEVEKAARALGAFGQKVHGSAQHLLSMVNELLDWAKIESGQMAIARSCVPLHDLVSELVEEFRQRAEGAGLSLAAECDEVHASVDPQRMRQVLYNLIENAVKFTETGGISVSCRAQAGQVQLVVEDTGCGIDEADRDRIFNRFEQIDGSNRRRHGGTGLGLAIVRHIVELHGGRVRVTGAPGKGSRFEVQLPL